MSRVIATRLKELVDQVGGAQAAILVDEDGLTVDSYRRQDSSLARKRSAASLRRTPTSPGCVCDCQEGLRPFVPVVAHRDASIDGDACAFDTRAASIECEAGADGQV